LRLGLAMTEDRSTSRNAMENNMKKGFGWYFLLVGIFGIVMAFARAKSEREMFLILATIPMAFLVVRSAEFLRKRNRE
jgi:succinate-acetate transporter protein